MNNMSTIQQFINKSFTAEQQRRITDAAVEQSRVQQEQEQSVIDYILNII